MKLKFNIYNMRYIKKFNEAIETECQTDGAIYQTDISEDIITMTVKLPFALDLDEKEAELLETNIHNAMELVLVPYFKNNKE